MRTTEVSDTSLSRTRPRAIIRFPSSPSLCSLNSQRGAVHPNGPGFTAFWPFQDRPATTVRHLSNMSKWCWINDWKQLVPTGSRVCVCECARVFVRVCSAFRTSPEYPPPPTPLRKNRAHLTPASSSPCKSPAIHRSPESKMPFGNFIAHQSKKSGMCQIGVQITTILVERNFRSLPRKMDATTAIIFPCQNPHVGADAGDFVCVRENGLRSMGHLECYAMLQ